MVNRSGAPKSPAQLSKHIARLYGDAEACAAAAGLSYVNDGEPGIRRRRQGRGFGYRDAHNRPVKDTTIKARIVELAIPPAWTNVWICPDDSGHIMAVGEDDRGRKQYIYHERWRALRDLLNFYRLINFGEQLPAIRAHVRTQLRRRTIDRDHVLATMIGIIDLSAIRIGNEVYAEENDSFGLTTLTSKHVSVTGAKVRLTFPAKSGQDADLTLTDHGIARVIGALTQQRRRRLFTVDGSAIDSAEVNARLQELTGEHITAKDFRTWQATHLAFEYLEAYLGSDEDTEHTALAAVDLVAERLGNTRAVARAHYIHPHVLSAFVDGTFETQLRASARHRQRLLAGSERRLLAFLKVALVADLDATALGAGRAIPSH
jgi:DNA topoisomerase I